ncbi:hypothetical protein CDAR_117741 [Caerostris darwini]|uniref:Uncharacterized protein n=1 Tax=Caerostris darwini TaxID=1538125 RepID=A0AAV4Q0I9_9ARAC|nr:hypothetical protein CDAR_117741 [Caerostris darwini]
MHNIKSNINANGVMHADDKISANIWVENCSSGDHSPILLYKDQNTINEARDEKGRLSSDHNEFFAEMTRSYINVTCLDFTHGINSYGFVLATVLVWDGKREGFPAVFIISNRSFGSCI